MISLPSSQQAQILGPVQLPHSQVSLQLLISLSYSSSCSCTTKAYATACAGVNINVPTSLVTLTTSPGWDGPFEVKLTTGETVVTVAAAAILGGGALLLLSNV